MKPVRLHPQRVILEDLVMGSLRPKELYHIGFPHWLRGTEFIESLKNDLSSEVERIILAPPRR